MTESREVRTTLLLEAKMKGFEQIPAELKKIQGLGPESLTKGFKALERQLKAVEKQVQNLATTMAKLNQAGGGIGAPGAPSAEATRLARGPRAGLIHDVSGGMVRPLRTFPQMVGAGALSFGGPSGSVAAQAILRGAGGGSAVPLITKQLQVGQARLLREIEQSTKQREREAQQQSKQRENEAKKRATEIAREEKLKARAFAREWRDILKQRSMGPDLSPSMQRAQELNALVPGLKRTAGLLGMKTEGAGAIAGLSRLRQGFGAAAMFGGIASGSPMAGAAGGGMGGMLMGGGAAGALMGGAVGLIGAAVVGLVSSAIRSAFEHTGTARSFLQGLQPMMAVAPTGQSMAMGQREIARAQLQRAQALGFSEQEALQIVSATQRAGGGFAGTPGAMRAQETALQAFRALGVNPEDVGNISRMERRGMLRGTDTARFTEDVITRAFAMGFEAAEVPELVKNIGDLVKEFEAQGRIIDPVEFMQRAQQLAGIVGPQQAMRLQQAGLDAGARMAAGGSSGNFGLDLMLLRDVGGLEIGPNGVTAGALFSARQQIRRLSPTDLARSIRNRMADGDPALQAMMFQRLSQDMGLGAVDPDIAMSQIVNRPMRRELMQPALAGQQARAFEMQGGLAGRAQAMTQEFLVRNADVQNRQLQQGIEALATQDSLRQSMEGLKDLINGPVFQALGGFAQMLKDISPAPNMSYDIGPN